MPFEKAMTTVMQQLKGKRVGIDNTGSSRVFLDAITEIGDFSFDDVDLAVLEDARLVNLARGGNLDFVSPAGAAQNVMLLKEGWYPAVSITDLIENLPLGDPRGIGSIGHRRRSLSGEARGAAAGGRSGSLWQGKIGAGRGQGLEQPRCHTA